MSWIKRNLYFLIGTVVALALLGLAGFYLYSKWSLNNKVLEDLTQKHEDLKKLNSQNPHPGSGNINNIDTAREQIKEVKTAITKTRPYFEKIGPIPDLPKITDFEFSTALAETVTQLARSAANNSVLVPTNAVGGYSFSFQAERNRMGFAAGSLPALARQLGEVKALCEVFFAAKVNSLDYIRRERVSPDDAAGSQSDYLPEKSITNALAILSPYEISFHCFSPEFGAVLSGLANSSHNFIVQYVNVEPAPLVAMEPTMTPTVTYQPQPIPAAPTMTPEQQFQQRYGTGFGRRSDGESGDAAFRARYGLGPGGKLPGPQPQPPPTVFAQPSAPARTALPTVIDEKQLKVTLLVNVVKLIPAPQAPTPARPATVSR